MKVNVAGVKAYTTSEPLLGIYTPGQWEVVSAEEGTNDKGGYINCRIKVGERTTFAYLNAPIAGDEKSAAKFKTLVIGMKVATAEQLDSGAVEITAGMLVGKTGFLEVMPPKTGKQYGTAYFITEGAAKKKMGETKNGAVGVASPPGTIGVSSTAALNGLAASL